MELTITELGAQGDGIAEGPDGKVYVSRTVPGDIVKARVAGNRAAGFELLEEGPHRRNPPCPHFSECGGCALQHLASDTYRVHKEAVLRLNLDRAQLDYPEISSIWGNEATRRRCSLTARGRKQGAIIGYRKAGSRSLAVIDRCLLLTDAIQNALPSVRHLVSTLVHPGEEAGINLTRYDNGIDVGVTLDADLYEERRVSILQDLGSVAGAVEFARVTVNDEPAIMKRAPVIRFGDFAVAPPHDAFLQPSFEGETALTDLVLDNCPDGQAGKAVDLFAGCGTFSLPLARQADVIAYESHADQVAALDGAARSASLSKVKAVRRDLFKEPLGDLELRKIDYAVINPPRAGAKTQSEELAKSNVPVITYISCNPATLARDSRILSQGGYKLKKIVLVDQFVYSAHSECVTVFKKEKS